MIDIHCHLLFNVDDGSKDILESVKVIRDMNDFGYNDIILTPHYISKSNYSSSKEDNIKKLNELKEILKKENISVNLFLGNEIYIDYDILDLLKDGIISTLNNSHYLLIELPMSGEFNGYLDIFSELKNYGYKIILAHPERYLSFQNDFNKIYELVNNGIYLQSNIESIIAGYGKSARKLMKRLLKEDLVSVIATDIHHAKHDYTKWNKAKKKIVRLIGEEKFLKLTTNNPKKIILDDTIE